MIKKYNGNHKTEDDNIESYAPLISPYNLKKQLPLEGAEEITVRKARQEIREILDGISKKILLVIGPCSIHDTSAANEYAERLNTLKEKVEDQFVVVMRTYFEKPRTAVGWKGLIYEPYLDCKGRINEGLSIARELLKHNAKIGLPSATEFLDTFVPQYIADLVSWAAIGARTVESPPHRQMASGLSMPVGFKNSTQGDIEASVNALISARYAGHSFFSLDQYGTPSVVTTKGNEYAHLILRGGKDAPNYDSKNIEKAQKMLGHAGLEDKLMVDCSHGNSNKDCRKQLDVFENVIKQRLDGNSGIIGLMLESNINEGSQKVPENLDELKYGVSITDSCIGWKTTEELVLDAYKKLST